MQQETDRNMNQINEAHKLMAVLNKLSQLSSSIVQSGSLVITTNGNFYLSVSAGAFAINENIYIAVSAASPIGLKLKGCSAGDEVSLNNKLFKITEVL